MGLILGQLQVSEFRNWFWFENCALLGYYAACSGNYLPTFRDNLSVHFQRSINLRRVPLGITTIGCGTSQKTEVLIYFSADVRNLARLFSLSRDRMKAGSYSIHSIGRFKLDPLPGSAVGSCETEFLTSATQLQLVHQTDRVIVIQCAVLQCHCYRVRSITVSLLYSAQYYSVIVIQCAVLQTKCIS